MIETLSLPMPRRRASIGIALASLTLLIGATPAQPAAKAWSTHISTSAIGAHIVGNPAAKVRLVEYYSYTCPHCAHFAAESATALKTQYVDKGLVVVEYRNMVRDPVDMTAALLAHCGDAKTFVGNHQAIFAAQSVCGSTKPCRSNSPKRVGKRQETRVPGEARRLLGRPAAAG